MDEETFKGYKPYKSLLEEKVIKEGTVISVIGIFLAKIDMISSKSIFFFLIILTGVIIDIRNTLLFTAIYISQASFITHTKSLLPLATVKALYHTLKVAKSVVLLCISQDQYEVAVI